MTSRTPVADHHWCPNRSGWLRKLRNAQEGFSPMWSDSLDGSGNSGKGRKNPENSRRLRRIGPNVIQVVEASERLVLTTSLLYHRCSDIHCITVLFSAWLRSSSPPASLCKLTRAMSMSMSIQSASCVPGVSAQALSRAKPALKNTIARSVAVHS